MPGRITYRARQFWNALFGAPLPDQLAEAARVLSPAQFALFCQMQPGEQVHSLDVYQKILEHGETDQDLLVAALLHDVGKNRFPLNVWERVLVVVMNRLAPKLAERWGGTWTESQGRRWQRPFAVAVYHPDWGAEMAARAGSPALAVRLIRRHQHSPGDLPERQPEERLLCLLQAVDDDS